MSRLATLANQVTFKKSFSDKVVLEAFVRDITGESFTFGIIETEKEFTPSVGKVAVKYDIFAESEDGRVIVELQRVRYDNHFDRFMHYFLTSIVEQVGDSTTYAVPRRVICIVLLTARYKKNDLSGRLVEDSMLITDLDPRTVDQQQRHLFQHKLIFLNPRHAFDQLPAPVREWMHLVEQSLKEPDVDPGNLGEELGLQTPAAIRAAQLSLWDGLTVDERTKFVNAGQEEQAMVSVLDDLEEERRLKAEAQAQVADAQAQVAKAHAREAEAQAEKAAALARGAEAQAEINRLRALLREGTI